jgi:hypothetical protein
MSCLDQSIPLGLQAQASNKIPFAGIAERQRGLMKILFLDDATPSAYLLSYFS